MLAAGAVLKLVLCLGQLKLATVGFSQVGLSDAQASFYAEHFSVQLQRVDEGSIRVTTPKDMAAVLGIEKQKQLLGCADESSSCMAELAGALGADGFVTGQLAKVGQSFQLNVKILAGDGSRALFIHSSKLLHTEEELIEELNAVAVTAIERLRGATASASGPTATATAGGGRSRSLVRLIPAAVGVVALGLGAIAFGSAGTKYGRLSNEANWPTLMQGEAASITRDGKVDVIIGSVAASLGAALLLAGLLWYLLA